jgi:hypothetical protein
MRTPHGQWLDDRSEGEPRVVIADRANARLQFFSLDGKPVEILQGVTDPGDHGQRSTQPGPDGASIPVTNVHGISFPADIDVRGEYLLVPDLHARILIFDGRNRLVANLGFDADWTTHVLDGMQVRRNPADWRNGAVRPSARCLLRSPRQYLCHRMGRSRPDHVPGTRVRPELPSVFQRGRTDPLPEPDYCSRSTDSFPNRPPVTAWPWRKSAADMARFPAG